MDMNPSDLSREAEDVLDYVQKNGIKMAIGSSSKNAGLILDRIGIADRFDAIADGNHITRSKPDPEVFLLAAEMLKLPPSECLVVEDAEAGAEAAEAGGFDCAGLGDANKVKTVKYKLSKLVNLIDVLSDRD
jgi:HAD superfamily hydrolase (TIGR01509 family)